MKTLHFVYLSLGLALISCSNETKEVEETPLDSHEVLYNNTADSLRKYMEVASIQEIIATDSTILDYTSLNYSAFRQKYKLKPAEMNLMAAQFKVTYEIAKAIQSINDMSFDNEILVEPLERLDSYSFDRIMPLDSLIQSNTVADSSIIRMMERFDEENQEE